MKGEDRERILLALREYLIEFAKLLGSRTKAKESYRRMNQVLGAAYFTTGLVGLKGEPFRAFLHEILDAFVHAIPMNERAVVLGTLRSIVLEEIIDEEIELEPNAEV